MASVDTLSSSHFIAWLRRSRKKASCGVIMTNRASSLPRRLSVRPSVPSIFALRRPSLSISKVLGCPHTCGLLVSFFHLNLVAAVLQWNCFLIKFCDILVYILWTKIGGLTLPPNTNFIHKITVSRYDASLPPMWRSPCRGETHTAGTDAIRSN